MRFILRIILVGALAYGLQIFLPFWSALIAAFVVGLILSQKRKRRMFGRPQPPPRSFLAGFIALFVLWGLMAWMIDAENASLLSGKIADMLPGLNSIGGPAEMKMILITALVGGLLGGFGTMTGNLLGEALR